MANPQTTPKDTPNDVPTAVREELENIVASVEKAQAGLGPEEQLPPHPREGVQLPKPELKAMFRLVADEQGLCKSCAARLCRRRGACRGSPDIDTLSCIDRFSDLSIAKLRAAYQGVLLAWIRREAVYDILRDTHPDSFKSLHDQLQEDA